MPSWGEYPGPGSVDSRIEDSLDDKAYGEFYVSTALTETITAGTYVKISGGATTAGETNRFTSLLDNRMLYTSGTTKVFLVTFTGSSTSTSNNIIISFRIAKNGTSIAKTAVARKIGTGGDVGAFSISALVELAVSDYVELFADVDTTNAITVNLGVMTVTEVN